MYSDAREVRSGEPVDIHHRITPNSNLSGENGSQLFLTLLLNYTFFPKVPSGDKFNTALAIGGLLL